MNVLLWIAAIAAIALCADPAVAATYYVAPSGGSDSNSGTSTGSPFATIQKGHDVAVAGDTVFVRGGTFSPSSTITFTRDGTSASSRITIQNFSGEKPVIDCINQPKGSFGVRFNSANWYLFKGFEIKNASSRGMQIENGSSNNIIEFNNIHHTGRSDSDGRGIQMRGASGNNLILNNDLHHNKDIFSDNADGILISTPGGTGNVLRGNRAFRNSDDGYDTFCVDDGQTCATVEFDKNYAYENGCSDATGTLCGGQLADAGGNGFGFKLGGTRTSNTSTVSGGETVTNNLSWNNKAGGFDNACSNGDQPASQCRPNTLYNNTAYNNGGGNYVFYTRPSTFRNNLSIGSLGNLSGSPTSPNQDFNSWTLPVTVNSADFLTLDPTCAKGPRQADGSLPDCNFLKLAAGSDLIDKGTNVGIAFNGSAPDLGAYETGGGAVGDTTPPTVSITAPAAAATVSGTTVTVSANATDAVGVVGVQFKLDGSNLQAEDQVSPYSIVWDTTSQTNGTHTLSAVARDAAGNTASPDFSPRGEPRLKASMVNFRTATPQITSD